MKTYPFKDLTSAKLSEVVAIVHERRQPAVWEALAGREIGEFERSALGYIVKKLYDNDYKTTRVNEATIWSRAIYPVLALAERDGIRAWSLVPLSATFDDVEIRGEADGALAQSINEELGLPYLVVVEAKRGVGATDPMAQILGAMLCAARLNADGGCPRREIYGCYTVADVWVFLRGTLSFEEPKPTMSVLTSREYTEKVEAAFILAILVSIVATVQG